MHGKLALLLVVAVLKTEPEESLSKPYLVEINALDKTRKHKPVAVMVALVNIS